MQLDLKSLKSSCCLAICQFFIIFKILRFSKFLDFQNSLITKNLSFGFLIFARFAYSLKTSLLLVCETHLLYEGCETTVDGKV